VRYSVEAGPILIRMLHSAQIEGAFCLMPILFERFIMNSPFKACALAAAIAFTSAPLVADDAADTDAKSPWSGTTDINALITSGNSSQTSFGIGGKLIYAEGPVKHTVTGFADFNRSNGLSDRERYGAAYNLAYSLSERTFFSGDASYESNKFGAFRERIAVAAGIGYHIFDDEKLKLTVEAAPSVIFSKNFEGADYESDFSAFVRTTTEFQISETTKFSNVASAYFGGRTIFENKAALQFKIIKSLSSKISFDVLYDQDAPAGRAATDTIARVGVSYGF